MPKNISKKHKINYKTTKKVESWHLAWHIKSSCIMPSAISNLESSMNLQHKLGSVQILSQYPVKGLDAQNLQSIDLQSAVDRQYALLYTSRPSSVPSAGWRHKSNFLCAYTAGKLLKKFQTFFSQNGTKIVIHERATNQQILSADLSKEKDRASVELFFEKVCGEPVSLVRGPHFGNTNVGATKGNGNLNVIHIINAATVREISNRLKVPVCCTRFRPNVVVDDGLPAWHEFQLVGGMIQIGSCTFKILGRTIRCDATRVDACHPGNDELDMPALLRENWPEHGEYLGVYAQLVVTKESSGEETIVRVGDVVTLVSSPPPAVDLWALSMPWRVLHSLGALTYLMAAVELLSQMKGGLGWMLNFLAFLLSVNWSISRDGGPGGFLQRTDHAVAYSVIAYNYHLASMWPGGILGVLSDQWTTLQVQAFVVCHLALPVFFLEDVLRKQCHVEPWVHYGVAHFLWRLIGGYGGLLVARASRNTTVLF